MRAVASEAATAEADRRAHAIVGWRQVLTDGLDELGIAHVESSSSFVLARLGPGGHAALRRAGIGVRRADTFPGLDASWVRIAVRPPDLTHQFLVAAKSWSEALSDGAPDALG